MTVPKNAKKPQDRQTAKSEVKNEATEIVFKDETYVVAPDALDNIELIEAIEDEKFIKAIRMVIGDAQWAKYKESNRDENGRVLSDGFQEFVEAIFRDLD